MINKVAITPANVTDAKGVAHVLPNSGAVYADKGYCVAPAKNAAKSRGIHFCAIKKNNMKQKNFDLDRYYTWHRQVNGGKGVTEHLFENYAAAMD
ncbi:transposase [Candidatus Bandiella euplotis]|uniref:IS5 family transposase n=1 Tax=Candidatus Bandiella euplotis TaxID=1664265 RepID=A0ABZ0UPR8_9RICK|nr:transposase [Candidatus Bandiella woodruffii]WPX97128.1 IS5 family transposase [Candidatus Bandiella woodruffii]